MTKPFKDQLEEDGARLGLWQAIANPYTAEICANCGFDWLLLDAEHSPNTLQTLLAQAQALAPYPLETIARVPSRDPVAIMQYLDLGIRTLLVPMIETADQARQIVAASRYPPAGVRGVSSATARAARFGFDSAYLATCNDAITLVVQIESRKGMENSEEIAGVPGVDAIFIGPSDLAASLGHLGDPIHEEVQGAIARIRRTVSSSGKPVGIFGLSAADVRQRMAEGFKFVSVGTDIGLLLHGGAAVLASIREDRAL